MAKLGRRGFLGTIIGALAAERLAAKAPPITTEAAIEKMRGLEALADSPIINNEEFFQKTGFICSGWISNNEPRWPEPNQELCSYCKTLGPLGKCVSCGTPNEPAQWRFIFPEEPTT